MRRNTPDFAMKGIATTNALARKLWLASTIQGHRNPFGKPLLEYNMAQLDFVLEMMALEQPERYSFVRSESSGTSSASMAKWTDVLKGAVLTRFMERIGLVTAMQNFAAYQKRKGINQLQPGLTRKGKKLDATQHTSRGQGSGTA